jgi:hypothetical protein
MVDEVTATQPPDDLFRIALAADDARAAFRAMLPWGKIKFTRSQIARGSCSPAPAVSPCDDSLGMLVPHLPSARRCASSEVFSSETGAAVARSRSR